MNLGCLMHMVIHPLRTHIYHSALRLESNLPFSYSYNSVIVVTEYMETIVPYSWNVDQID